MSSERGVIAHRSQLAAHSSDVTNSALKLLSGQIGMYTLERAAGSKALA
jgi:hypothetical protein